MWGVDKGDLGGADQRNNVGQRTEENREAATEFGMLDALNKRLAFGRRTNTVSNIQLRASCRRPI